MKAWKPLTPRRKSVIWHLNCLNRANVASQTRLAARCFARASTGASCRTRSVADADVRTSCQQSVLSDMEVEKVLAALESGKLFP
eukprot:3087413-Pyramimonas_sp.AAC.1